MKSLFTLLTIVLCLTGARAQEELTQVVPAFNKLVVSPRIHVVLQKGDKESVRIAYSNVDVHDINIKSTRGRLHLYLTHAKVIERPEVIEEGICTFEHDRYENASITAYVTYRELNHLQVRGEQEVTLDSVNQNKKFKLKVYGGAEVRVESLSASQFKVKMYGSNYLKISGGEIARQKYRLFGENKIDTRAIESEVIHTRIYGQGSMRVRASDEMVLTSFGEPSIQLSGSAHLHPGIVIGNPRIRSGLN